MRGRKPIESKHTTPPDAFPAKPIEPPSYLDDNGKAEYVRLSLILEACGTLGKTDPRMVEMYSINYSMLIRAAQELQESPLNNNSNGRLYTNPLIGTIHNTTQKLTSIQSELGLTPTSINKVEIEIKKKSSGIDDLVKERNGKAKKQNS